MQKKFIKYIIIILLFGLGFYFLMQQAIEQGRFYHAKEDNLIEASLLAYNPLLNSTNSSQLNQNINDSFYILSYVQFYDFLTKSVEQGSPNTLGKVLAFLNDQIDEKPYTQKTERKKIIQSISCRLLNRKKEQLIPAAKDVFSQYQSSFINTLKLSTNVTKAEKSWGTLTCNN